MHPDGDMDVSDSPSVRAAALEASEATASAVRLLPRNAVAGPATTIRKAVVPDRLGLMAGAMAALAQESVGGMRSSSALAQSWAAWAERGSMRSS